MPRRLWVAGPLAFLIGSASVAAGGPDPLRDGFASPPDAAKPRAWWHWMNGNVTRAGITADLEAMRQVGLGGATVVNVDCGIPRGPVAFMGPEWRADFKFAVAEADRLGLKLCVENCAGWSSSGGPWNTPANAMRRLTASRARADGPARFDAVLARPPTTLDTYRDVAVVAFQVQTSATTSPATTAAAGADGKLDVRRAVYEAVDGGPSADVTAAVVGLVRAGRPSVVASNADLGGDPAPGQLKRLRLEFTLGGRAGTLTADENDVLLLPTDAAQLARARAAQRTPANRTFVSPPPADPADVGTVVPRAGVVDLTSHMSADGRLRWDVPPGRWVVLRVGYTPVGVKNHPAPREGLGLECDKLSATALDAHWNGFMQPVLDDVGPLAGKSLDAALIDSYEVGGQDWTPAFRDEFRRRRGYDPVPFLPTFARFVVDGPDVTDRFLWDVRRTVADLFADNYYGHFADLCHRHGLGSDVEPYTGPFESMQCGRTADVVMGEFWTGTQGDPSVRLAASIAHTYGKTLVGAESFTTGGPQAGWQNDPASLKPLGDLMFCQGLNRVTFHRYAMQPWPDRRPGMTMGEFGLNFERTLTWWAQAKGWVDYLARCQFLLQQGRSVADVAYFTGESAPVETRVGQPAMPAGYDYDSVDADVLVHGATVDGGRVRLASGASYAVLVLPPNDANLTPGTLGAIDRLVRDGATVVGPRPQHSPSLADYPACDAVVAALADGLWGPFDGSRVRGHAAGRGRVVWGQPLATVLADRHLPPDFEPDPAADARLAYVHRVTAAGADIYFVSNQRRRSQTVTCTFRVGGKRPELFHPDAGTVEPAAVWGEAGGRTTVRLDLDPAGSTFVVFRPATATTAHAVAASFAADGSGRPHALRIVHADYAATDGTARVDVTALLSARVRDGRVSIEVKAASMGGDPAAMHAKALHVDYTVDGKAGHADAAEDLVLTLPTAADLPGWEPTSDGDGRPAVRSWTDGRFTAATSDGRQRAGVVADLPAPREVTGPWALTFPPGGGAPPSVTLDKLVSWPDHAGAGVRYFSGTGTYHKTVALTGEQLAGGREVWLDLGAVRNFADVSVNGRPFATLWKPPFRLNVTAAVRTGGNDLAVAVTNLWPNRLIGDEQLPPDCVWNGDQLAAWPQWLLDGKPSPTGRLTFTTWHHWKKGASLLPSGLLGPVMLRSAVVVSAT